MVKHFSVDWLAQSHHSATPRPHVPCMVQPRQPTSYDKDYLQPKAKTPTRTERAKSAERHIHGEPGSCSPLRPATCASPISEISEYSSGYESEAASSECPSPDEGSEADGDGPQRRVRTKFTPEQINKLEKLFRKHKYLDAGQRGKAAQKLDLSETQVRTWFQNRRMKLKRDVQNMRVEYLAPSLSAVMFQQFPPVQHHGQLLYPAVTPAYAPFVPRQMRPHQPLYRVPNNPHFY